MARFPRWANHGNFGDEREGRHDKNATSSRVDPVRDVEASAAFYEGLFDLTRLSRPPFAILGVWLACDDRQVHVVFNESGTYRATTSPDMVDVHFAFRTDDFEGMVERLKAAGFSDRLRSGGRIPPNCAK